MARTRPGTDFPTRSERLLSQTGVQCTEEAVISGVDDDERLDGLDLVE